MVAVNSSCLWGGGCWSSTATRAWLHAELLMGQEVSSPLAKRARACPLHIASVRCACLRQPVACYLDRQQQVAETVGGAPSDTLLLQSFVRLELHVPLGWL